MRMVMIVTTMDDGGDGDDDGSEDSDNSGGDDDFNDDGDDNNDDDGDLFLQPSDAGSSGFRTGCDIIRGQTGSWAAFIVHQQA